MSCNAYKYVFIVTYGRSGSTLLQNTLNNISGFNIKGENGNSLFPLFRSYLTLREVTSKFSQRGHEKSDPWYGINRCDVEDYKNALLECFLCNVIKPNFNDRVIGFKEIRYTPNIMSDSVFSSFMDFLFEFGDVKIIFNIRKKESVAKSGWWKDMEAQDVYRIVEQCDERFNNYHKEHPQKTMVFSYDSYIGDINEFKRLCFFLNEKDDDDIYRLSLGKKVSFN